MNDLELKLVENSKRIDGFKEAEKYFFKNSDKCKMCGEPIFYENYSKILWSRKDKVVKKSNSRTSDMTKTINGVTYNLCVCEHCLIKKFPEIKELNPAKWFNTTNDFSIFAFDVDRKDADSHNKSNSVTLKRMIERYGEIEGNIKWDSYVEKQRVSNTFEFKNSNHGWDLEKYDEYNKSRAVTLENMILKYGEELGRKKFKSYQEKQRINGCSLSWFVSKYGEIQGNLKYKAINKQKRQNIENFELRYGKENAMKEYIKYRESTNINNSFGYSKISQAVFDKLDKRILEFGLTTFYNDKNKEYLKILTDFGCVYLDYFIKELNICVEFNGDYFHANPDKFNEEHSGFYFNKNITAKEIWAKDFERISKLKSQYNIDTIIIWESDDYNEKIEEIYNIIRKKING